jgi:hypothetical protein
MVGQSIIVLVSLLFMGVFSLFSKIDYTGKEKVTLINTVETRNCFVSYVKIKGRTYLIKQKKDYKKQLAVVRDALSAYIAEGFDIAHQIHIIECKKKIPGKIKSWWPATLHTIVPGETVRKQKDCKYRLLRLRQFWAQAQSFNEKGLTKLIINHMTWHKQLPLIVALDLIIGNSDRHCGNLCYDPISDKFYAIDMDDTFNKDLCLLACKKLKSMMHQDIVFTQKEINALKHMKQILILLLHKHKPKDLIKKLHYFAKKAGFTKGGKLYNDRIRRKLLYYEKMIVQTNESAYRLIAVLNKIIKHKSLMHINGESNVNI